MSEEEIDRSQIIKVSTPRGDARSMAPISPSMTSPPVAPGEGADWLGPQTPLRPIAPPEVAGRAWDFVPGYNLNTTPRPYEAVSFPALRALAESYDPCRLIIERRKDQMTRLPWTIRIKHEGHGKRPKSAQLSAATRERIAEITHLFKKPEYGKGFRQWLRELLEDLFVIDAPSLFLKRDWRGELSGLQVVDGATIKRVLSDWGRVPEPVAVSEVPFDWNGRTVTQENFSELGFTYRGGFLWPTTHQQILKGMPAVNYTALNFIYAPLNLRPGRAYGMSPCEQILTTVATAMRRAQSQLEYFREGNVPEAIYGLPETWSPDQTQRFQEYWDSLFSGNLANRRRMKFVVGDGRFTALKEPPLKNEFDEWLVRIVCHAFSYPPTAFVSLSNRSVAEQHERSAEEEGVESLKAWFASLANVIIDEHLGEPEIEFAWAEEDVVDQEKQSIILTKYLEDGALSINEVRERLGEEPSTDPNADRLMVKTANGYVPIGDATTKKEITNE